jgi:pSer/pThr/pTyr-binding forkhead associated (FHA) protein
MNEMQEGAAAAMRLVVKRAGIETEISFPFSVPATVGRFDPEVGPIDIDLGTIEEGSYVSRKHAVIESREGALILRDLGSSNGTFIRRDDFERIEEAEIVEGDEIAFGNARLVLRTGAQASEPASDEPASDGPAEMEPEAEAD